MGKKKNIQKETGQRDGAWTLGMLGEGSEHRALFTKAMPSKTHNIERGETF